MSDQNEQASGSGLGKPGNNNEIGSNPSEVLLANPYHGKRNRDRLSQPTYRGRSNSLPSYHGQLTTSDIANDSSSINNHANNNFHAYYKKSNEIAILPEFNGKNISVTEFIRECRKAEEFVNPNDKNFFLKIVKSRVTGDARNYLQFKTFNSLEQLLAELKRAFTPTKNMPQLQVDLARIKQGPQDNVAEYGLRVTDILQKINEIIGNSGSSNVQGLVEEATETATQCFKLGLRPEITVQMAGKLITSFENAVSVAIKSELFIQQRSE